MAGTRDSHVVQNENTFAARRIKESGVTRIAQSSKKQEEKNHVSPTRKIREIFYLRMKNTEHSKEIGENALSKTYSSQRVR